MVEVAKILIQANHIQQTFEKKTKKPATTAVKLPELLLQSGKKRKFNQMEIDMDKFLSKKHAIFSQQNETYDRH
jgi:hypothetical protein